MFQILLTDHTQSFYRKCKSFNKFRTRPDNSLAFMNNFPLAADSSVNPERVLKMVVEHQQGYYHYYMAEVNWSVGYEVYYFLIPSEWIIDDKDLIKDAAAKLLSFIKRRQFRFLGLDTNYRYEVIDFKTSFISIEDLKKQEKKTIFRAKTNGEILPLEMPGQATQFAENLPFAKDKYSKPARIAPCFVETRKNGLNCNRNDLVEIKKLSAVFSTNKKIEISIKKCIQCWQLYKECFEVDESTKQFRNYFVKPNETGAENSFHFSIAEAEEYNKIDITNFVNPNL